MAAVQSRRAKFLVVRALRAVGLLKLADSCKYVLGQVKARASNRRFRARHPGFATPPRHLAFDALNHVDWDRYRETGLQHAGLFARVLREELPGKAPLEVLEWGCGPGRLIRHMAERMGGRPVSLTGTDYNPESVAWCRQNLPGIGFAENGLDPPLPFGDDRFDAIYCFSVVTHLSEAKQLAWVKELRRVLKPGGVLVCTTHGEAYRYHLATQDEKAAFDAGRLVVLGQYQEGKKWFLAIHPEAFVRDRLLEGWTHVRRVKSLAEEGVLQDVWVAHKPGQWRPSAEAPHEIAGPSHEAGGPSYKAAGTLHEAGRAPRFSIIMNVYNGRRYLREALASVFAQTVTDWELIFWDDRSSDGSAEVLREFPPDPRVRYFLADEHVPLAAARHAAIARARGEWVAFLDQDDVWTADKLHKQAGVIDASPPTLGLVYGRAMRFGDVRVRDFDRHHEFRDLPQGDIFDELFLSSCFICQSASCMRTDYVRRLGDFPPQFHHCCDYFLYVELASRYSAACTQDVVCWYRMHDQAMSKRYYTSALHEALGILERWKHRVRPAIYASNHRTHSTMLGLGEIISREDVGGGLRRILRDGSIAYLATRPFSIANRTLRRALRYSRHGVAKRPVYS